ncbi:CTP synthase [Bienertia sinuspersici]
MASHHTRSLSFPSKPHPIADQLDEHLCRLRSSQAASTTSLTNKFTGLNDLYQCVDEFLQLPLNQNTLSELLDGSLRLLDICATSRDVLVQSKERLLDLQSVLQRGAVDIKEVEKTNEANATESLLKDVQAVTVDSFKAEKETAACISEFDAFDATMELVMCQKKKVNIDISQVKKLESQIQEIDGVLECMFRSLIKTRAILLNVLSN